MTPTKDDCYYLGRVAKTRGFDGQLVLSLDTDEPRKYAKMERILVELHGALTPFFITRSKFRPPNHLEAYLDGIASKDAAAALAGNDMYLPLSDLPELPADQYYLHDLVGMEVTDTRHGALGRVSQVLDYAQNPLIQILRPDGEILIPLRDDFVKAVHKSEMRVDVDLPEGLVELNKP